MVPLALNVHFWLTWPLHGQMIALVPGVVPCALASRQSPPYTRNSPADVYVHCWLVWPLQSHSCTCVPPVCVPPGTSRHRPEPVPTIAVAVGGGLLLLLDGDGEGLPLLPPGGTYGHLAWYSEIVDGSGSVGH